MSESIRQKVANLTRPERRKKQRELKEQQKKQGKHYPPTMTLPNRKSDLKTVNEEKAVIQRTTEEKLKSVWATAAGVAEEIGAGSRPAESEESQASNNSDDAIRDPDVCVSNGLKAENESGNDHSAVT